MAKKPQAAKKKGSAKGKKPASGSGKAKKPNAKTAKKLSQTIAAQQQRKPKSQQSATKPSLASAKGGASKLSQMQEAMRKRLDGGKFRMLNEQLYTTTGDSAFATFQSEPELFDVVRALSEPFNAAHSFCEVCLWFCC